MTADDEFAVRNVIVRLALYADGPDVDAYVELFAADAVWDMPGAPRRGHAEIRAGSEDRRAAGQIGPGSNTRHAVSTVAVAVDGDRAVADSYWQFYVDTAASPRLQLMGAYHDELVRVGADWKLLRRQITIG
jgi:ketosteroid isomerase-like protein